MRREVHVEVTTPIATVRLDRVEMPDMLTLGGWQALAEALDGLSDRDDVGCVVVCGTGRSAYSAGVDLAASAQRPEAPSEARAYSDAIAAALRALRCCRHPTVAVIEGLCVGGGLDIAACCDLRVCGESCRFGAPIRRLELTLPHRDAEPLAQLLGASPVLGVLLSGELIGAERALRYGLVNRVHADVAVGEQGYGLAARIAAGAPLMNRWYKQLVRRLHGRGPLAGA
jgi:enoyl-CoA hydratase